MKKTSIKTITVGNIVNFVIVMVVMLLLVTGINFRALSKSAIEKEAVVYAEFVKASFTAQMKMGLMKEESFYLDEIRELKQINKVAVIRGAAISEQFAIKNSTELIWDESIERAFTEKSPVFSISEFKLSPTVRALVPYIATSEGQFNCLACHNVEEGTVLGLIDITLDVSEYRNQSLFFLAGILIISLIFISLIIFKTSRIIQTNVQEPLDSLILQAKLAYINHKPVNLDQFKTSEFTSVANEINLFNSEVIAHQNMLEEKNTELMALNNEIESTLRETVYTMGVIEEQRSLETANHTKRVALYSQLMAKEQGLSAREVELITTASPLHDIGKIGIADEILLKPGPLSGAEIEIMKNHARIGYTMLRHSDRDILQVAAVVALEHHEKWDGSGYPQGLQGEEINIYARIVALADVFDALFSCRVYKQSWALPKVIDYIKAESGKHLDPKLVEIFLNHIAEFVEITERYPSSCPVKHADPYVYDEAGKAPSG